MKINPRNTLLLLVVTGSCLQLSRCHLTEDCMPSLPVKET